MPFSHHSHSGQFCEHAAGSLREMVEKAVERGFKLYCLTEHMPRYRDQDLYEEEIEAKLTAQDLQATFDEYVTCARALQSEFADRIELLVGCETDVCRPEWAEDIEKLMETYKLDFCVGSVHHVNEIPIDFSQELCDDALKNVGGDEDDLFLRYFDHMKQLINRIRPSIVGHLDLIRLFRKGDPLSPRVKRALEQLIDEANELGCAFELNTAGFRKAKRPWPRLDVLEMMIKRGAKLVLSDDAHCPDFVGLDYAKARDALRQLGVKTLYRLKGNDEGTVDLVPVEEGWEALPCWDLCPNSDDFE